MSNPEPIQRQSSVCQPAGMPCCYALVGFMTTCFLLLLMMVVPVLAAGSDLPASWRVRSVYQDPLTGRQQAPVVWLFTSQRQGDGWQVEVRDENQRLGSRAVLRLSLEQRLLEATIYNQVRGRERELRRTFAADKPALVQEALMPVNWLNVGLSWAGMEPREVTVKRMVGRTGFSTRLRLEAAPITIKEALAAGMLLPESENHLAGQPLLVVKISNMVTGEVVCRQLWAESVSVWLYEQAGDRTSWYLWEQ